METKYLKLGTVTGKVQGEIDLIENELLENYGKIQYSFETQKYTEGTFNLNIETINFPKNKEHITIP